MAVAGNIVRQTDSSGATVIGLASPRTLAVVAILHGDSLDSRIDDWVILQAEKTGSSYLGVPVLNVVDILPEHWADPAMLGHYQKGFGAYSGFGQEPGFDDYAMVSFEDRRAYDHDTGQALPNLLSEFRGSLDLPSVVLQATSASAGVTVSWIGHAGIRYDLLAASNVAGPYLFVTNALRNVTGPVSFPFSPLADKQFFRLRY